jgi:hypothetical protein
MMKRTPRLVVVSGNAKAPLPAAGRVELLGEITIERQANADPNMITLAAVTAGGAVIGTLTLPFDCMDMRDPEWLLERAERVRGNMPNLLT